MTNLINLHGEERPTLVTVPLAWLRPTTIVAIANDISNELHELEKLSPCPEVSPLDWLRVKTERQAYRSLFRLLFNYISRHEGQPLLSKIRLPEEAA